MVDAAQRLELLTSADRTNTITVWRPTFRRRCVPLLHIADPTAERIKAANIIGLLGTASQWNTDSKGRLIDQYGLDVIGDEDRATVH